MCFALLQCELEPCVGVPFWKPAYPIWSTPTYLSWLLLVFCCELERFVGPLFYGKPQKHCSFEGCPKRRHTPFNSSLSPWNLLDFNMIRVFLKMLGLSNFHLLKGIVVFCSPVGFSHPAHLSFCLDSLGVSWQFPYFTH